MRMGQLTGGKCASQNACSKTDVQLVYNALHVDNVTLFMTIMSIISVGNVVIHLTHPHAIETDGRTRSISFSLPPALYFFI